MPNVSCEHTACIYNDIETNLCTKECITLEYECCNDELRFSETEEYGSEYWISVQLSKRSTRYGRVKKHGKKLEINGRVFYTESDIRYGEGETYVTDADTGAYCCSIENLKKNWERYLEEVSKWKKATAENVMALPVCEYDCTKKCYIIVESEVKND